MNHKLRWKAGPATAQRVTRTYNSLLAADYWVAVAAECPAGILLDEIEMLLDPSPTIMKPAQ